MLPTRTLRLAALLVLPATLAGCASLLLKKHDAPDLHVDASPANVARGAYLVNHVSDCFGCHSPLTPGHMPVPGKEGAGGRLFDENDGLPGTIYTTNLTSDPETGLGNWTDGEILRAMREGVAKDGTPLFPIMPYPNYHQMSDADAHAVIAYLRTLKPVRNVVPERKLKFPLGIIVNFIPKPVDGVVPDPGPDPVARGEYLVKIASCADCHTPMKGGQPDKSKAMAGGMHFAMGPTSVVSANITQDRDTGIGNWTDEQIATAITQGVRPDGKGLRPVMPWPAYKGLMPEDVAAMVSYLRTIKPIRNELPNRF